MNRINDGPNSFALQNINLKPDDRVLEVGFTPKESLKRIPITKYDFSLYESDDVRKYMKLAGLKDINIYEGLNRGAKICCVSRSV